MLKAIEQLAERVDGRWKKKSYERGAFPTVAYEVLRESKIHEKVSVDELVHWMGRTREALPHQLSLEVGFGQPPITLYWDDRFLIDAYFWTRPEMALHNHAFSGAVTQLEGNCLHSIYDFPISEGDEGHILMGDVKLKMMEMLHRGDVRRVPPGAGLIHEVWHLSYPALSLIIRTHYLEAEFQYTYLKPHLAVDDLGFRPYSPLVTKKIQTMEMLQHVDHPLKEQYFYELASQSEYYHAIWYLRMVLGITRDLEKVKGIVEKIPKLKKWAPHILESFQWILEHNVDWDRVTDEDERFFLALIRSCSDRKTIDQFIEKYAPQRSAEESAMIWLKGIMEKRGVGFQLNETAQEAFGFLLRGNTDKETCEEMLKRYRVRNTEAFKREITETCRQLRSIPLLRPLLLGAKAVQRDLEQALRV